MSRCDTQTLTLTAGQKCPLPLEFAQPVGDLKNPTWQPVDLTGATVRLIAKRSLRDADADAVLDLEQDAFDEPESGRAVLDIDLTALEEAAYVDGLDLKGSVWLIDADGNRVPYGNFDLRIEPSALRWDDEE